MKLSEKLFSFVTAFVPSWKNQQIIVFRKGPVANTVKLDNIAKRREVIWT